MKQYFVSSVVVHTVKTHAHAGDDAVEHGDQAGDSTLHTRVLTATLISSTSKRRLKPIDPNYTAFGCNRLAESSPRKDDSVMVEPRKGRKSVYTTANRES